VIPVRPRRGRRRASKTRHGFNYYPDTGEAYFEVYEPGTKRKRRLTLHGIESAERAVALYEAFKAKVKGRAKRAHVIAPTFREFFTEYFEDIRAQVREHTAESYKYTILQHILPEFGALQLTEITAGMVNRWSARLITEGYSGATVNGYVNTVRLLLGYALKWDVIEDLPIRKPLDKYEVNLPCNELSLDEERRFLAAFDNEEGFRGWIAKHHPRGQIRLVAGPGASKQLFGAKRIYGAGIRPDSQAAGIYYGRFRDTKPLFVLAVETGLRRGDLLRLTWTQIDLKGGVIEIVTGKTRRKAFIPISTRCRQALIECRSKPVVAERVFVDGDGDPFAEKTIVRYFAIAKQLAGFGKRLLRFHDLRHSFASKLAREGVNIEFIAATMAHSSTRMTQRYARPGDTALDMVAKALDRAAERDDFEKQRGELQAFVSGERASKARQTDHEEVLEGS
jgi:integrase